MTPPPSALELTHAPRCNRLIGQKSAQVFGKTLGAAIAFSRFLLQALEADGFQIIIDAGIQLSRRHWFLLDHLLKRFDGSCGLKGRPTRHETVEKCSEGIYIGQ